MSRCSPIATKLPQSVASLVDALVKIAVGHAVIAALKGDFLTAAFCHVAVDKIGCRVEYVGNFRMHGRENCAVLEPELANDLARDQV